MNLRDRFSEKEFLLGVELVTTRGLVIQDSTRKVLDFGRHLAARPDIDWISVTDNAGGNPTISADNLGELLKEEGGEVLIHFSAKDMNRNALESRAWHLASLGLDNLLVLTGDYPVSGFNGVSRPVFDLDSVSLLTLLHQMNQGLRIKGRKRDTYTDLNRTRFFLGAVTSPFKQLEEELLGQYLKLDRKIAAGAEFIITQVGYDARKWDELRHYLAARGATIPLVGYVYLLNRGVARLFHRGMIAGCVVSDQLFEEIEKQSGGPDRGKGFCLELAAQQVAVLKGLGYRGAYIGGVSNQKQLDAILQRAASFGPDQWRQFAREIQYPLEREYYLYEKDPATGLANPQRPVQQGNVRAPVRERLAYAQSRMFHDMVFEPGTRLFSLAARLYRFLEKRPVLNRIAYYLERLIKSALFSCRECGDCSLPATNYLCPESQCPKRQRNGPCGGSFKGQCEVEERPCLWVRAYRRSRGGTAYAELFQRPPIFVDNTLRETSSWANTFLGRDWNSYRDRSPGRA